MINDQNTLLYVRRIVRCLLANHFQIDKQKKRQISVLHQLIYDAGPSDITEKILLTIDFTKNQY